MQFGYGNRRKGIPAILFVQIENGLVADCSWICCKANKAIAEKLGVTGDTVKIHLHSIYEQLGVRSRIEIMVALTDRSR
jgi:FixJ family two-component response regulator